MSRSRADLDKYFAERAKAGTPVAADPADLTEREYLRLFAARPGLYLGYTDLRGVTSFLNGYDLAAQRHGGPGLQGFPEWLIDNYVGQSSFAWSAMITQIALPDRDFEAVLTSEQELHVLEVLFDLLDRFLADREKTT
ncbi:hypothetical protein AB0H76_13185 [Nocardia sp. NPDC050712]|uniref:hypothetical protein n=1 Tax=Nocardia sp. NPDC050712 TaxID=3155518 RepID=UPI0033FB356E